MMEVPDEEPVEPITDEPELSGHIIARLARQLEVAVSAVGLSLAQYRLLAILGETGEAAASKLAELMAVSRPTITGVVDGLVARGLVAREAVEGDRRRVDVVLTEAGRTLIASADKEVQRRIADIRSLFS
jgi:DNA-binding MarR family transcriptional regulator